jgi:ADP-L-glycero-D-manno-heptose 6-epimerase
MILVTGGLGFIGSNYIKFLNNKGIKDIIIVDKYSANWNNLIDLEYIDFIDSGDISYVMSIYGKKIRTIVHLGACADTTKTNFEYMARENFEFSKELLKNNINFCQANFIYASSAAVYGNKGLPLNVYGLSKKMFDEYAKNYNTIGLRFFNVYGPREEHKGKMMSFIGQAIKKKGNLPLFKGSEEMYRDFVYVEDVCKVIEFFRHNFKKGIYDVGSGESFCMSNIPILVSELLGKKYKKKIIPIPAYLKDKLQYLTKAELCPLREAGYTDKFCDVDLGTWKYVSELKK